MLTKKQKLYLYNFQRFSIVKNEFFQLKNHSVIIIDKNMAIKISYESGSKT